MLKNVSILQLLNYSYANYGDRFYCTLFQVFWQPSVTIITWEQSVCALLRYMTVSYLKSQIISDAWKSQW